MFCIPSRAQWSLESFLRYVDGTVIFLLHPFPGYDLTSPNSPLPQTAHRVAPHMSNTKGTLHRNSMRSSPHTFTSASSPG